VRQTLGVALQFACLVFLPLMIIFQINFRFELIWMPTLLLVSIALFYLGHRLRTS